MMRYRKSYLHRICYFLFSLILLLGLFPMRLSAAEEKVIRVAYVIAPGYQEGGEGEYKTGYGYEYLYRIAEYNNWKYEYVYGSFGELLEKLRNGEVDLMGNLSYTEERAKDILYGSYEEGKENYYLYTKRENSEIDVLDYSTLNGKKIGVNIGSFQEQLWTSWCKQHGITTQMVGYTGVRERYDALNNGDVDATIGGAVQQEEATTDWKVLINFGSSPFYFGVNKNRPDLLAELNAAQKEILEGNPYYNEEVHDRYMKTEALTTTNPDDQEKVRLQENNGVIKVGYLSGFQPLSYQDENGVFKGIGADALDSMTKQFAEENIRFEAIAYSDYDTMIEALKNDEISMAWPVYTDYWNADQSGISLSNQLMSAMMTLVFDGEYTSKTIEKIGVSREGSLPRIYAEINYPDSKIVQYENYSEAVDGLIEGKVTSVLYETSVFQVRETTNDILHRLSTATLPETFGISFGVRSNDRELISVLNKGITVFGEAGAARSLLVNSAVEKEVTLKEYFSQHPVAANILISAVMILIAGLIISAVYNRMALRVKESKAEKEIFERMANSDVLTGLLNRRAYETRIKEITSHPEQYPNAVLQLFDINGVKRANEHGGRPVGDQLLMNVAQELSRHYGEVYRIAGDSFAVINTTGAGKEENERISVALEKENMVFTLACGQCALKREDGSYRNEQEWKTDADIALYNDKLENKAVSDYSEEEKLKAFIFGVSAIVDAKDTYTAHHSERVKELSVLIASKMGLSDASIAQVQEASELHDIGKIAINDTILQKQGKLTEEEFETMKSHPVIGSEILSRTTGMFETAEIVRHHHERFDGKGYPDHLVGKEIPIESRIIAVADSIDAMTSSRCYRKALSLETCYEEIQKNLGKMYDPAIGQIALDHWAEIAKIIEDNR